MPKVIADPEARGEYVHHLDQAHRRGLITWESVQPAQDAVMPRCTGCGAEAMIDSGTGLGARCFAASLGVELPSGESCMTKRGRR